MNFPAHLPRFDAKVAMWIIILIHVVFVLATPLFPFIDLPNHLAEATIYKYHDAPGNSLARYDEPVPWYYPNTFHTVFCSLFPDVEIGNRIFMALYILALQMSLYLVIRELKGNPWFALLGTLFTFNYNVTFGFVGFAISIPAVILLFYVILLDLHKDNLWLKAMIALLFIVIFLMHAQTALFAAAFYGLTMLVKYKNAIDKLLIRVVLVPLPLILFILIWWSSRETLDEQSTSTYLLSYYTEQYLPELLSRARLIIFDNYQLASGPGGALVAAALFLSFILPVIYFRPWKSERWKEFLHQALYPILFFLCALICYLLLPTSPPGQSPLSQRFCTFVNLALIIVFSVFMRNVISRKLRAYVLVVCSVYMVLWFEYIFTFNAENKSFRPGFFEGANKDKMLAGLIYENRYRRSKVYIHFPNYFIVWKRGIATTKIIDYRFGVVRRVASENSVPFYDEYVGDHYKHLAEYKKQDYFLVRGRPPVMNDVNLTNSALLRASGAWKIYRNNAQISATK